MPRLLTDCRRWMLRSVGGLLILLGVLGCRPRRHVATDSGYYTGALPNGQRVWFRWEEEAGEVTGELRSLATVEPETLRATNTAHGFRGRLAADWGNDSPARDLFLLRSRESGTSLDGLWLSSGATKSQPVSFTRFAESKLLHCRSGFRFHGYGRSHEVTVRWPQFPEGPSFLQAVNAWLENDAKLHLKFFQSWTWSDLEEMWEQGSTATGEHYLQSHWDVVWATNGLISLLEFQDTYQGGAHDMYGYRGANFQWLNGRLRKLELSDFFRPGSGWQERLSPLIVQDLRRQQASWPEDAGQGLSERTFTFNANGMQFYFDPYEAGSFAEGTFTVHIPWEQLTPFLPTNGMVKLRPTGVLPRLPRSEP